MRYFNWWIRTYQVEWWWGNFASTERGWWENKPNVWVPPAQSWEQDLWPGRGTRESPFTLYLRDSGARDDAGAHNSISPWTRYVSLWLPVDQTRYGCHLPAASSKTQVPNEVLCIPSIERAHLEACISMRQSSLVNWVTPLAR